MYTSFYGAYYFFCKNKKLEQNEYFLANPDIKLAREVWNFLESKYAKKVLKRVLPSITVNKKIYIPMLDTKITIDNIDRLPNFEELPFSETTS